MSFTATLKSFENKIVNFFESDKAKAEFTEVEHLITEAMPIVAELSGTGYVPAALVEVFAKYGVTVEGLLHVAATDLPAIKSIVGDGVKTFLQTKFSVSATVAQISRDIAYLQVVNK